MSDGRPATAPTQPDAAGIEAALVELAKTLKQAQRSDLVERATAAISRLKRPSTIVCVVGEFKQGKSSLVNGLLGQSICPIDDDLATSAITLVRYGEEPSATVRRRDEDGTRVGIPVPIEDLPNWVSEAGNPKNAKHVERVEIAVPSALLKGGLVVVDTPGMGGLGAGHAAATLGFLPFADGLIFVSDASAELSAPEIDVLRRATELCPMVLFAQTKIDLYPHWERIHELNRGHLERHGLGRLPSVAVSSAVRAEALVRKDRALNEGSRFPQLVKQLGDEIVTPAKDTAAARSAGDGRAIASMLRTGLESERTLIGDPAATQRALGDLEAAKSRLDHLRGPGARWSVLVGDKMTDLSNSVNFEFRAQMRAISRDMDEMVEGLQKGDAWDDMVHDLQADVADAVADAFVALEAGRAGIRAEVVEMLGEEQLDIDLTPGRAGDFDVTDLWEWKALDPNASRGKKKAFETSMTTVRGAQGGIMMFGMMGQFLPRAAGALLATNPVLLGIGALFGGIGLADDRKRKVAQRRQTARTQVRQFLDDVQFEVGNQIGTVVREIQREIRDEFTERLGELQRTYADIAKRAQDDAQRTQGERQQRTGEIDALVTALTAVERQLASA